MEENEEQNNTCTAVLVRKGTVLTICGVPYHLQPTMKYQEYIHGTYTQTTKNENNEKK